MEVALPGHPAPISFTGVSIVGFSSGGMAIPEKVNDALRAAHADHDRLMKRLRESDGPEAK